MSSVARLVFVGASRFGLRCLQACAESPSASVVGLVTAPAKFGISYRPSGVTNVLHADCESWAREHGIPASILSRSMMMPAVWESVRSWRPDLFVVAGWYHMVPRRWRELAPAYGMHASLLPDYSGGAPLVWAMMNGEQRTGITLFQMNDAVDGGPIVDQAAEAIRDDDTIATLYSRIEDLGLDMLRRNLPFLAAGTMSLRPQDERLRRVMPQRAPEDGEIDWSKSAPEIDRFIRAQTRPYPGAFCFLGNRKLIIWQARVCDDAPTSTKPGMVVALPEGEFAVACGTGCVVLEDVSIEETRYTGPGLSEVFAEGEQALGTN